MTNEEIQRVMELIIKQQESFAEGMERMRESHERGQERLGKLETAFVTLFNVVADIGKAQKELTVQMKDLAEAQAHTDQRLNVLIDIIAQGRGGTSEA
jgi:hypothetical protein